MMQVDNDAVLEEQRRASPNGTRFGVLDGTHPGRGGKQYFVLVFCEKRT